MSKQANPHTTKTIPACCSPAEWKRMLSMLATATSAAASLTMNQLIILPTNSKIQCTLLRPLTKARCKTMEYNLGVQLFLPENHKIKRALGATGHNSTARSNTLNPKP